MDNDSFKCLELPSPWAHGSLEKQEIGNFWSLGLGGMMKNVPSGPGDWVRGAVPGESICLNVQLPELYSPASSSTLNCAGLDLYLS